MYEKNYMENYIPTNLIKHRAFITLHVNLYAR